MLETIRIEYQEKVIREINKNHLTKEVKIKRQNGVLQSSEAISPSELINTPPGPVGRKSHKPDKEGYYHRKISSTGNFKINNLTYYFNLIKAGQEVLILIKENKLYVYDLKKVLMGTLDKRKGKRYS